MDNYNNEKRISSALKTSITSVLYYIIQIISALLYRIIFLEYFTLNYLGINGLFSNILTLLSLTELGITTPIVNRLYKPFDDKDVVKIRKLLKFYGTVYKYIFGVIIILGVLICPFIKFFIKDISQIPAEINIYFVYILFLFQTASTYLLAHYQSVISVDRKQYILNYVNIVISLVRYGIQIILVIFSRNYVLVLLSGIVINILANYLISIYVKKKYTNICNGEEQLDSKDKKSIFSDSKKVLVHRIGYKTLTATDNIIISSFIGLYETGLYSNYLMITNYLTNFVGQLLGNLSGIIGNVIVSDDKEHVYEVFQRLMFVCFWVSSSLTILLYGFFNEIIRIWLGVQYCFSTRTVTLLCIYFYITNLRTIPNTFIGVSPLFTKDVMRPIIQAVVNLVVSIILVQIIGIDGVIIGSIVCVFITVFWREPYLLYRYLFNKSFLDFWYIHIRFTLLTGILCYLLYECVNHYVINDFISLILVGGISAITIQLLFCILFRRNPAFKYFYNYLINALKVSA